MSNESRGKLENLKGRVKQAAGTVTGDKSMEAEGALDRAKGAAQEKVGEAERKLDEARRRNQVDDDEDDDL